MAKNPRWNFWIIKVLAVAIFGLSCVPFFTLLRCSRTHNMKPVFQLHSSRYQSPRVFYISSTTSGGSLKYIDDLRIIYEAHGVDFIQLLDIATAHSFSDKMRSGDFLFFQYVFNTDFTFADVRNLVLLNQLRLVIPIHDRYFLSDVTHVVDERVHTSDSDITPEKLEVLKLALHIIFPSHSIWEIYSKHISFPTMAVVPHVDLALTHDQDCMPAVVDTLNIGIITEVSPTKGEDLFQKLFPTQMHQGKHVKFFFYSDILEGFVFDNVVFRGRYKENDIFAKLVQDSIHGLLFLNNYPETYSYALTKGLYSGLPIMFSNMGALPERLQQMADGNKYVTPLFISTDNNDLLPKFQTFMDGLLQRAPKHKCKMLSTDRIQTHLSVPQFYDSLFFEKSETIMAHVNKHYEDNTALYAQIHQHIEPYAVYFPQFHQIPENDLNFYSGYTDMVNLVGAKLKNHDLWTPLKNVFGFYDLKLDREVLPRQVATARSYGLAGFAVYYYWFSQNDVTGNHTVFTEVIDQFFELPMKDFTVFFDWCNEGWTSNVAFTQNLEQVVISNQYTEEAFTINFNNLARYFKHDNYRKINNQPLFSVHHPELMSNNQLLLMKRVGDRMAQQHGFTGIAIILNTDPQPYTPFHYYNMHPHYKSPRASDFVDCSSLPCHIDYQYYTRYYVLDRKSTLDTANSVNTAFVRFDNSVRYFTHNETASFGKFGNKSNFLTSTKGSTPSLFQELLSQQFRLYGDKKGQVEKIFIINAWNEWGEQMALEPSNELGFGYLEALKMAMIKSFTSAW